MFGTELDLMRSGCPKLVQPGRDPPTIVLAIRLDPISHDTTLFSRLDDSGLVSGEVEPGRSDGRVVGIVPSGRDSVRPELGSNTGVVRSDPDVPRQRHEGQCQWRIARLCDEHMRIHRPCHLPERIDLCTRQAGSQFAHSALQRHLSFRKGLSFCIRYFVEGFIVLDCRWDGKAGVHSVDDHPGEHDFEKAGNVLGFYPGGTRG
jgi:hypothetical protein